MRYPLLLMELLSATPDSHPDKSPLTKAVLTIKDINFNINEYKRRKDLVLKYRKGDENSLIDKISKLNIHSIIKKSNRVSSHLKHLTGFAPQVRTRMSLFLKQWQAGNKSPRCVFKGVLTGGNKRSAI
ncbi:hypothetical protein FKM82_018951, partial [Ascaphus truei]